MSVVSFRKVRSVEMDFRSLVGMTGVGSSPWALRQMVRPDLPSTRSIMSTGISWRVPIRRTPRLRRVWYVFSPTIGILRMPNGARKGRSVPRSMRRALLGLASPVATLETVLFSDSPKEMGRPVSRMMRSRSSRAYCQQPKKRSMPVRSA